MLNHIGTTTMMELEGKSDSYVPEKVYAGKKVWRWVKTLSFLPIKNDLHFIVRFHTYHY